MKSTEYLEEKGISFRLIHLTQVPKSAQDVVRLYGCPLNHVLKTIVFIGEIEPLLVVLPGDKRADFAKLSAIVNQKVRVAKPDEVKEITGYDVGGVSPFGLEKKTKTIIDSAVFDVEKVNIGSGKAEIGIEISSSDLKKEKEWIVADVSA